MNIAVVIMIGVVGLLLMVILIQIDAINELRDRVYTLEKENDSVELDP